ncbi:hypothetical protein ACFX1R_027813 [Malus domestica]
MISTQLSDQIFRPLIPAACVNFRRLITTKSKLLPCPRPKSLKLKHLAQNSKWAIRQLSGPKPAKIDGIDRTAYDEGVKFRDPITKHDTITGYLLNIAFLKIVFMPKFSCTGPNRQDHMNSLHGGPWL